MAHRHIGTQTHRHIGTQTHRHRDTETHRHTDTQAHRHTDTQAHRHIGMWQCCIQQHEPDEETNKELGSYIIWDGGSISGSYDKL
jgi:hypothetical protein